MVSTKSSPQWNRPNELVMLIIFYVFQFSCTDLCEGNNYVLLIFIEAVENIKKEFFRLPYIRIASNSIKHYWNGEFSVFFICSLGFLRS